MNHASLARASFRPQRIARVAGFLYLLNIVGGGIAELGVRQRLVVDDNAAATMANILAHEQLYRWGFASDLVGVLCVVPLILLLFELLRIVDRRIAVLAVFFSLVGTAVQTVALLGQFVPLFLLK